MDGESGELTQEEVVKGAGIGKSERERERERETGMRLTERTRELIPDMATYSGYHG